MNLSDTQLILLSNAAQRDDFRIVLPERLRGSAAEKVLATLLGKGLIEVAPAGENERPVLGNDAPSPTPYRITASGFTAIGLGHEGSNEAQTARVLEGPSVAEPHDPAARPARAGSKRDQVIALLAQADGASLARLVAATGWLPHTARAALSGLRKSGFAIERRKCADGGTVYAIPAAIEVM